MITKSYIEDAGKEKRIAIDFTTFEAKQLVEVISRLGIGNQSIVQLEVALRKELANLGIKLGV